MQYATAKSAWALVWAKFEISSDKWSILIGGSGGTHSFPVQCSMRGAVCQCICSSWGGLDVRNDNWIHIPSNYKLQCMPCWLVLLLHFWSCWWNKSCTCWSCWYNTVNIPRPKFNIAPEKLPSNGKVVFQPAFFRGYVKLQGCTIRFSALKHQNRPRIWSNHLPPLTPTPTAPTPPTPHATATATAAAATAAAAAAAAVPPTPTATAAEAAAATP